MLRTVATKASLKLPLEYDVYEVLPSAATTQRASVIGLEAAWQALYDLAATTTNECFALHAPLSEPERWVHAVSQAVL